MASDGNAAASGLIGLALVLFGAGDLASSRALEQVVFAGRVTGEWGSELRGAQVWLPDSEYGSVTDSTGQYRFAVPASELTRGEVEVRARSMGYRTASRTVAIAGRDTLWLDFVLEERTPDFFYSVPAGVVDLKGSVTRAETGNPLVGVEVASPSLSLRTRTTPGGRYWMRVPRDNIADTTVSIVTRHTRYRSASKAVRIPDEAREHGRGQIVQADFKLDPADEQARITQKPGETIFLGRVVDAAHGRPLGGAQLYLVSDSRETSYGTLTDTRGWYRFTAPKDTLGRTDPALRCRLEGYRKASGRIDPVERDTVRVHFAIENRRRGFFYLVSERRLGLIGRVTSGDPEAPLARARVSVPTLGVVTNTDSRGWYGISVPRGMVTDESFQIFVSARGFDPADLTARIGDGSFVRTHFVLEPDSTALGMGASR